MKTVDSYPSADQLLAIKGKLISKGDMFYVNYTLPMIPIRSVEFDSVVEACGNDVTLASNHIMYKGAVLLAEQLLSKTREYDGTVKVSVSE